MTLSPLSASGSTVEPDQPIKIDKKIAPATTKTDSGGSEPGTTDIPKSDKGL